MADLRLNIAGYAYGGWTKIHAALSIQQIANSFGLEVSETWKGQQSRRPIAKGSACTVRIDGVLVLTGYADAVPVNYDATNHTVAVNGRSKCGDLVDCSADTFDWTGLTLAAGAQKLCDPFGINVVDLAGNPYVFASLKSNSGATVFEVIEQAARVCGVLVFSDARGNLVIARAAEYGNPVATLKLGDNVKAASSVNSIQDCFSQYVLMGQLPGSPRLTPGESAEVLAGPLRDSTVPRYRPLIVNPEWPVEGAAAEARLRMELNVRSGRGQAVTYEQIGWLRPDGLLWEPNVTALVDDDYLGIKGERLVADVEFILDDQAGEICKLTVMPRESFDTVPMPEPEGTL